MEMTEELHRLFAKIGATSDLEKQNKVADMYNTVFNAVAAVGGTPTASYSISVVHPAITALRIEFKRHLRRNPFVYFSPRKLQAACVEAEGECQKVMTLVSKQASSPENLKKLEMESIQKQMREEQVWFGKVNEWRREVVLKANLECAVKDFKVQLWNQCFSDEHDILAFNKQQEDVRVVGRRLEAEALEEFSGVIPHFEETVEVARWTNALQEQLSQVLAEALEKFSVHKIAHAVAQYEAGMGDFLSEHLFAPKELADLYHVQIKCKCEQQPDFREVLESPIMKCAWDAKIHEEWGNLERGWREKQDGLIRDFREGLKMEGQKLLAKATAAHNNLELDDAELEALFAEDFEKMVRRIMEKAEQTQKLRKPFAEGGSCPKGDDVEEGEVTEDHHQTEGKGGDHKERVGSDDKNKEWTNVNQLEGTGSDQTAKGTGSGGVDPKEMINSGDRMEEEGKRGPQVKVEMTTTDPEDEGSSHDKEDTNGSSQSPQPQQNSTLVVPIWIIFGEPIPYHRPILKKGTKFPTPPTTTVISVYTKSSTVSIPFYEHDWGRRKLLGKLTVTGVLVTPEGKGCVKLTYLIDASGLFHVEATVRSTGERFSLMGKTSAVWSEDDENEDQRRQQRRSDPGPAGRIIISDNESRKRSGGGGGGGSFTPSACTSSKRTKVPLPPHAISEALVNSLFE